MKKKIINFFINVAVLIIFVIALEWLVGQSYGDTVLTVIVAVCTVFSCVVAGIFIYRFAKCLPHAKKNKENIAAIMDETLKAAAGEKAEELHGQVYGMITRLIDQTNMNVPCFAALTSDMLIIVPLGLTYVPYSWLMAIPTATLTKCLVKPSFIPGQHVVKLRFEEKKCSLRFSTKLFGFHALTRQEENVKVLLEGLEKIQNRIALKEL